MTSANRMLADALRAKVWEDVARASQLPPKGDWRIWLLLGGRGSGKTRSASEYVTAQVMAGHARHVALVGRTAADVRDVMVEGGQSGLLAVAPKWFRPTYEPSKRRFTWPNGAVATAYSADEPDLLRGPQHDLAWVDELAAFEKPDELWSTLLLGLRLGQARCVVSTTPRPIQLIRDLVGRDGQDVGLTRMTTFENIDNLAPGFVKDVVGRYASTHLGRQELYAEILTGAPGALWTRDMIEGTRVADHPSLPLVVVGVDPSVSGSDEGGAETGIIVAGLGDDGEIYVLDDASVRTTPREWAHAVAMAYRQHDADRVVVESNQGGELVRQVIQMVDPRLVITPVYASVGKRARAEPVVAMYEQGHVHHVETFPTLEDQMCAWVRGSGSSPDRLDALVWAITDIVNSISGDSPFAGLEIPITNESGELVKRVTIPECPKWLKESEPDRFTSVALDSEDPPEPLT